MKQRRSTKYAGLVLSILTLGYAYGAAEPVSTADNVVGSTLLSPEQIRQYNAMSFSSSVADPVPLALTAISNNSAQLTDNRMISDYSNRARIESGGVPLQALQGLLEAQLLSSGRFQFDNRSALQLHIWLRDYRNTYRPLNTLHLPALAASPLASVSTYFMDQQPQVQVTLDVLMQHDGQVLKQMRVVANMAPCQQLDSASVVDVNLASDEFMTQYTRTAIGQAATAAINFTVEQVAEQYSGAVQAGRITARNGERLQLDVGAAPLLAGSSIALYHRDRPWQKIGHLRIERVDNGTAYAYPIDLHSGSIAIGDRVFPLVSLPPAAVFLPVPALQQCHNPADETRSGLLHALNTKNSASEGSPEHEQQ